MRLILWALLALVFAVPAAAQPNNGFAPNANYAQLSVTTASSRVTLPAGGTVVLYNTGTNAAFCRLGSSTITATTAHDQVAPGGFMSFVRGSNVAIACITATSTTTVNVSGGAGIATGSGGGGTSGGGGGDATAANQTLQITQETATNTNLGAPGATACATDTASCNLNAFMQRLAQRLTDAIAAINGSIPAGTATIGNVNGAPNVTPTNCSGTITAGGTAQNAFTAGATKHGFTIQNLSTEDMWVSFTTTAVANTVASYMLNPSASGVAGGSYSTPFGFGMNTALSVVGATTGNKFSCTWW